MKLIKNQKNILALSICSVLSSMLFLTGCATPQSERPAIPELTANTDPMQYVEIYQKNKETGSSGLFDMFVDPFYEKDTHIEYKNYTIFENHQVITDLRKNLDSLCSLKGGFIQTPYNTSVNWCVEANGRFPLYGYALMYKTLATGHVGCTPFIYINNPKNGSIDNETWISFAERYGFKDNDTIASENAEMERIAKIRAREIDFLKTKNAIGAKVCLGRAGTSFGIEGPSMAGFVEDVVNGKIKIIINVDSISNQPVPRLEWDEPGNWHRCEFFFFFNNFY